MKKTYLEVKYGKDNSVKGYTLDLSCGGIGIACPVRIKNNTIVQIKFKQNNFSPLKGKVVSVVGRPSKTYGYRLGVMFISAVKKKEKMAEFIKGAEDRKKIRLNLL